MDEGLNVEAFETWLEKYGEHLERTGGYVQ
jgi:hypothetical protein